MQERPPSWYHRLLDWYDSEGRDLPWRVDRDPYRVWVSEIMLQQTRVEAVRERYRDWLQRFPTVQELAAAGEDEVMDAWAGLGYYRRGRNLHRAARVIVREHGEAPTDPAALRSLPGVGEYTAAAVASIAGDHAVAAVDGNVLRVMARIGGIRGDVRTGAPRRQAADLATKLLHPQRPGDWNQAVMDLGATICTPRAPACGVCPLAQGCHAEGDAESFPAPRKRVKKRLEEPHLAVVEDGGCILLVRNPDHGLLAGMWALPGGVVEPEGLPELVRKQSGVRIEAAGVLGQAEHLFTHRRWRMQVHGARALDAAANRHTAWVPKEELPDWPMPTAYRKALDAALPL